MTKIIELRPKKSLMNSSFEKYQYSTDAIPITSEINLKADVYRLELSSNQESFLEARLFAFHNHLFKNPYNGSCWLIDKNWAVWRFNKTGLLDQLHLLHASGIESLHPLYNPSIGFTKNNIAVISDGGNCLTFLVEDVNKSATVFTLRDIDPGIILDVQHVEGESRIIVAMCAITNNSDKKNTKLTVLSYVWKKGTGDTLEGFEFLSKEVLKAQGAIEYLHIEDDGDYIHSICQDTIAFENPKLQSSSSNTIFKKKSELRIPKYCWSQDEDSITVWIKIEKDYQKKVKLIAKPTELSVTCDNIVLIQGETQHRLDENLTTWKYEEDTFRFDLVKYETGLMWSELIKGDTGGECLPNETLAAEIHSRLAHLCTDQSDEKLEGQPCIGFNAEQLEECDLEGRDNILQRINLKTQEYTHMAMLGANNHVLFTCKTRSGQAICLRHDHDACLWITGKTENAEWDMKHTYTFPGFGYVEASKTNKKFCVSPADGSYVAILEHTRHILLYERPNSDVQIGKQWIVDLGCETSPIMGAAATNKYLIVLTKDKLYRLQIYS